MSTDALRRASEAIAAVADPDSEVDILVRSLLAGLDADDRKTRVSAAWAACLVAEATDETVGPLAHGLSERLVATPDDPIVSRTLATLAVEDPVVVREAIAATAGDDADHLRRAVAEASRWELDEVIERDGGDPDVPTRRLVRTDPDDDVTHVERLPSTPDDRPQDGQAPASAAGGRSPQDGTDGGASGAGGPGTQSRSAPPSGTAGANEGAAGSGTDGTADRSEGTTPDGSTGASDAATRRKRERIAAFAESKTFAAIDYYSDFDGLTVVQPGTRRRYGLVVRTRARRDGTEDGVALRLFERPDADVHTFEAALAERIAAWAEAGDLGGVVSVHDWGDTPRPWVGTEFVEETLAGHGRRSPETALWDARALTGALADLHQRGVVHGGIDPRNVVFPGDVIDGTARPMLDSPGLLFALKEPFDTGTVLDPRYAAPEYFDRKFGCIDRSTDIYQLGAVVYHLFTGRPPYGSDGVCERVLDGRPPRLSAVDDRFPDALDAVVGKAMGTRKLNRYDTAVRFHREVADLCETLL